MQRRFVYLRQRWRTGEQRGARVIGRPHVLSLAEASEAEFEICFHRPSGTIALFVNGTRAKVWKDQELEEGALATCCSLKHRANLPDPGAGRRRGAVRTAERITADEKRETAEHRPGHPGTDQRT